MTLYPKAIQQLATDFDPYIHRLWYWERGGIWPRNISWAEAEQALKILTQEIGADNFRLVVEAWESRIEPGIDD